MSGQTYRLVRRAAAARAAAPELDEHQRAVVEHPGGPLLVLAGPGTGKTTTIVESVVDRVERRGVDPERLLILTFSRKAAEELRDRITARLRRTTRTPLALTFHSYAYALLRREAVRDGEPPPRLLTGPEQLLEVRRLLLGELEDGAPYWPEEMRELLKTRAFAEELRDLLSRAAERGLDGTALAALGRRRGRPDWAAAGRFFQRYLDRFDLDPVRTLDYAELIRAAAALLTREDVWRRERAAYDVVFVDEYQDTDPAQETLLRRLAGDGRDLIAVGDPDQSIYGFRGADVNGILRFPERFPTRDGRPAPVLALRVCRRSGANLLAASRRVASRLPTVASSRRSGHRDLIPGEGTEPGEVKVRLADSETQEAAVVADTLRRAHLIEGVPWSRMAVLVRSATRQLPLLRRTLVAAGVPVVVGGDETPLVQQPGVRPLLTLLRVAVRPETLDVPTAEELLTGPIGGSDAIGVRRLRRALRAAEHEAAKHGATGPGEAAVYGAGGSGTVAREAAGHEVTGYEVADREAGTEAAGHGGAGHEAGNEAAGSEAGEAVVAYRTGGRPAPPRTSDELLIAALRDPRELIPVEPHVAVPAQRVANLLAVARRAVAEGLGPEDALWEIWQASGLAERWSEQSAAGGFGGALADRDLDAVVALFDHAAKFVDRTPKAGVEVFLDDLTSQEIPASTLADHAPPGEAVRILTAHRAKGLEWDVVVVAGVQEGVWPDLRLRGSLLGAEQLVEVTEGTAPESGEAAAVALAAKLLAEERRLFYVAATRARKRLVVTAVGGEDTDQRPSRFLTELLPDGVEEAGADDRARWLSLPALVADLRAAVCDPHRPEPVRQAAAAHLARLAAAGVPGAHPDQWYALTPLSDDRPLSWPEGVVQISPSAVENFTKCGLRWLLENAVGAANRETARSLGTVIHAIAVLAAGGDAADVLGKRLDEVWDELDFGGVWFNRKQRKVAEQMIARFLSWHEKDRREQGRELVAREEPFTAVVSEGVVIKGRVDRLERDPEGRAVIIDIKTGSSKPAAAELERHPQLAVYQLATLLGAFERHKLAEPGGAALVQIGKAAGKEAVEQAQPPLEDAAWAHELVRTVALGMSSGVFPARVNDGCRTCAVRTSCPVNEAGGQVC